MASTSPIGTDVPPSHAATASGMPPLPVKLTTGTPDRIASSATVGNGSSREVSANTSAAPNHGPTSR